jgi:hypothetical protein
MATTKNTTTLGRDVTAGLAYLTQSIEDPTLRDSIARLTERARVENWTHEEYLAACIQREVSARESHGGEGCIRAARFRPESRWRTVTSPRAEEDDVVAGGDEVQGSRVGDGIALQAAPPGPLGGQRLAFAGGQCPAPPVARHPGHPETPGYLRSLTLSRLTPPPLAAPAHPGPARPRSAHHHRDTSCHRHSPHHVSRQQSL